MSSLSEKLMGQAAKAMVALASSKTASMRKIKNALLPLKLLCWPKVIAFAPNTRF